MSSVATKKGLYSLRPMWTVAVENNASGNDQSDSGARIWGADQGEFTADSLSAFSHSRQTEVSFLTCFRNFGVDACTIVADVEREIVRVLKRYI